jgi:hypothetical protein
MSWFPVRLTEEEGEIVNEERESHPNTSQILLLRDRLRHGPIALVVIALLAYAVVLGTHIGAYAAGADSSGYLNSARLFSRGHVTAAQRLWPNVTASESTSGICVPMGFRPSSPGTMVPKYPIGVPLLLMLTARGTGWDVAPQCMIILHAIVGILLMWWLGRCAGLSPGWASFGAALLATCPLYVTYSLQMMSDVPATTWVMATVVLAWNARRHPGWGLAAGVALGIAVLIRPTNVIVALPVAIGMGRGWRTWLAFLSGGAPLAVVQMVYNQATYGHPFASGYDNVGSLFQWQHVPSSLANYGRWLPVLLTPFGLLAFGLPWCARKNPIWTGVLSTWMLSFIALYAFYFYTHKTWWYTRFVLPAFPAVWIAALLVARDLTQHLGMLSMPGSASFLSWGVRGLIAAAVFGSAGYYNYRLRTPHVGKDERRYIEAIEWMRPQLPSSALLVAMQASGCLFYYTDFPVLRWDKIERGEFTRVEQAAAERPVFALLMSFEEQRAFAEGRLCGRWTKLGTIHDFSLSRFEPDSADPRPDSMPESDMRQRAANENRAGPKL